MPQQEVSHWSCAWDILFLACWFLIRHSTPSLSDWPLPLCARSCEQIPVECRRGWGNEMLEPMKMMTWKLHACFLICAKIVYLKWSQSGSFIQAFNSLVKGNLAYLEEHTNILPGQTFTWHWFPLSEKGQPRNAFSLKSFFIWNHHVQASITRLQIHRHVRGGQGSISVRVDSRHQCTIGWIYPQDPTISPRIMTVLARRLYVCNNSYWIGIPGLLVLPFAHIPASSLTEGLINSVGSHCSAVPHFSFYKKEKFLFTEVWGLNIMPLL